MKLVMEKRKTMKALCKIQALIEVELANKLEKISKLQNISIAKMIILAITKYVDEALLNIEVNDNEN